MRFLAALLLLAAGASPAVAQDAEEPTGKEPTGTIIGEIGGVAGEAVSFNYDMRYPNQFGFRLGATLDPGSMDADHEPGETQRDPDEPYSLLGIGQFFLSEGPFALEFGVGPVLQIDAGNLSMKAAGHIGLRVQPIFERFLLRVGYSPTVGTDGYNGYPAVGLGYEF